MARSRGSSRIIRAPRRKSTWEEGPGSLTAPTNISSTSGALLGQGITPIIPGLTAIRIRGYCRMVLTTTTGADDGFVGAVGIGLCTLAAFTAGFASVPTPVTEVEDENWLWWSMFVMSTATATIADGVNSSGVHFEKTIDTKAMRKFEDGMVIYAAIEQTELGTAAADVFFGSRILCLLP